MCEPTTIMAGLAIASAAAGVMADKSASNAQKASNRAQYNNAVIARNENIAQTNLQASQETEAAGQKIAENNREARKALSTMTVSAGESGIAGLSVDSLLADIGASQGRYNMGVQTNLDNAISAINSERTNANISANNVIASLTPPKQPNYLGAALQIGSAGAGWYEKGGHTKLANKFSGSST